MNAIQKKQLEANKANHRALAIKSMEKVLAIPSGTPQRWRAAFNHFLAQRPEAKDEAIAVAKSVAERRHDIDKFASTKNGRMAYSTPQWLLPVLRNTDPQYFESHSSKDFAGVKHLTLMKKAFPEFFYAEVI